MYKNEKREADALFHLKCVDPNALYKNGNGAMIKQSETSVTILISYRYL